MSVLLFLVKFVGWLLLGVLGLLMLVLLFPVSAQPLYRDGRFGLWVRVFGIRLTVVDPDKPRQKRAKKDKRAAKDTTGKKADETDTEKSPKQKKTVDWAFLRTLLPPAGRAARLVFRGIRVTEIDAVLIVSGREPHDIGKKTGTVWAVFGELAALLQQIFGRVSFTRVDVVPDFMDEHAGRHRFGCRVTALPVTFAAAGCIVLKSVWRARRSQKQAQADKPVEAPAA